MASDQAAGSASQGQGKDDDPFDDLFNLEEHHYTIGYNAGYADGAAQAALEARIFGIEKGFEKFLAMGQLRRQAEVWAEKHGHPTKPADHADASGQEAVVEEDATLGGREDTSPQTQQQGSSTRLQRHIDILLMLTDPGTLDPSNTDNAVAIFDDRLKRAQAKVKVIENIVGEDKGSHLSHSLPGALDTDIVSGSTGDIENLKLKPG